jgi:tetratricopeptide (TPR) repeat protein
MIEERILFMAFPNIRANILTISLGFCFSLLVFSEISSAKPAKEIPKSSSEASSKKFELENSIWLSSQKMLVDSESKMIRVIQEHPKAVYSNYLLSIYYMKLYKEDALGLEALRRASLLARQSIDLDPKSNFGYLALANIAIDIGQADKALSLIEQIEADQSNSIWQTDLIKAKVLIHVGTNQQKIDHFSKLVSHETLPPELFSHFAYAMLEDFSPKKAKGIVSGWYTTKKSHEINFLLGRAFQRDEKYKDANKQFDIAIKKGSKNLDLLVENGLVLMNHMNSPKKALKHFDKAIEVAKFKKEYHSIILADIHLHKGLAHLKLNQVKSAIESHVKSVKEFSSKEKLLRHLVSKYRKLGKPKELANLLSNINEEVPGLSMSYALLGEVLSDDIKKPNQAIKAYSDAITLSPDSPEYYSGMGLAYYKLKKFQSAADVFTIASQLNPEDASAKYNIACMLAILGKNEDAIENLKGALALDPSLQSSALTDSDFTNLKHDPTFKALTTNNLAH